MTVSPNAGQPLPQSAFAALLQGTPADLPLLAWDGGQVTAGELQAGAARRSAALAGLGLGRGDRIAVMLPNGRDWIELTFAAARLGLAIVSLNPRLGAKEVADLVSRTGALALIHDSGHRQGATLRTLAAAAPGLSSLHHILDLGAPAGESPLPGVPALALASLEAAREAPFAGQDEDPLLIIATSGTTSLPKLVVHLQGRIARHVSDAGGTLGLARPGCRTLLNLPLCGAFGFTVGFAAIGSGGLLHLRDGFDPATDAVVMRDQGITHAFGTNDMLLKLLEAAPGERPFPSLEVYAHANFTPGLDQLPPLAQARGVRLRGCYGMSETLALFAAQPFDAPLAQRQEGGGFPVNPAARFRVSDPETGAVLGVGETGMLELDNPNIMAGYLNDIASTAAAFTPDVYFRTGDLVRLEADGSFTFVARHNDVLRIGGYLVSPVEIEDVIRRHAPVSACQVVSVTLPEGVRPVAFLVPEQGAVPDVAALERGCRADLAIYKVPVRFFTIDTLPVTEGPNGVKVKKNVLRDMARELITA